MPDDLVFNLIIEVLNIQRQSLVRRKKDHKHTDEEESPPDPRCYEMDLVWHVHKHSLHGTTKSLKDSVIAVVIEQKNGRMTCIGGLAEWSKAPHC